MQLGWRSFLISIITITEENKSDTAGTSSFVNIDCTSIHMQLGWRSFLISIITIIEENKSNTAGTSLFVNIVCTSIHIFVNIDCTGTSIHMQLGWSACSDQHNK